MASSLIGSLRVALGLDTAQFEAGAAKAQARAKQTASGIEASFKSAKTAVEGLFAAFTVGLLTDQIKKSLDYAGSLAEVSRTLGLTTKDLQTFRFAASQSGIAQDQLEVGLRRLTVSMGKAELGSEAQAKAFKAIGISVDELKGKTTGDVFRLMADGLSKVTDRSQRAAIEMTLMGRTGSNLDNLLAPGAARLNELAQAAQQLGIVLSDQQIQSAEETAHKLEAVKEVLAAQIAGVVANNASAILSLSSALATLTGQIVRFLGSNPQLALGIVGALLGGRVGGLPGAVIGGAAGVLLGSKVAQSAADSNMDLGFRTQQLMAARNAYAQAYASRGTSAPAMGVAGMQVAGGAGQSTTEALAEFNKQLGLLRQATALSRANSAATPQGANLPSIFAPKDKQKHTKDKNEQDQFQFDQQMRQEDMQILEAKKALSHDIGEQAQLALQALDVQQAIADAEIDHKVAQAKVDYAAGKITKATLDQITSEEGIAKAKQAELTELQRKAILDQRDQALLQESIDLDSHGYDIMKGQLQKQADLAQTAEERRTAELALLDLQYKEQRIMLERIANESKNADDVAKANMDLAALDKNYALDRANVLQQTRGPLQQYLDSLPTTSAKWTEALQQVAVDGFGAISSSADTLAGKIIKIGGIFGDITRTILADLLKIELQKMVIAPLANALGSLFPGSGGGGGIGDLLGSAISGGGSLTGTVSVPGFATGGGGILGGMGGRDSNLLSLNGVPIARVSRGEELSVSNGSAGARVVVNQTIAPSFMGNAATQDDLAKLFVVTKTATIQAIDERSRRRS